MNRGGRHQQPQQGLGRGQGEGRGRGRGAPGRGRVRCSNEIAVFLDCFGTFFQSLFTFSKQLTDSP